MLRKTWTQVGERLRQPEARPLLAPGVRRAGAGLIALCVAVTVFLGAQVAGQRRPDRLDRAIDHWVRASLGWPPRLVSFLVEIGDPVPVTVITVALVVICLATRRWNGAVLAAVAGPAAALLTEALLKPLIDRTLRGMLSFPSGHTTGTFALAGVGLVLLAGPSRPPLPAAARALLVLAGYLVATAVGVAMVDLGAHYFTDTVAGAAVGTAVVLVTAFGIDRLGRLGWPGQRGRPPQRSPERQPAPDPAGRSSFG
jgi:membrane-associated phospholipid phosphatase